MAMTLKPTQYSSIGANGMPLLSKSWRVDRFHSGIYTGGQIQLSENEDLLACTLHNDVAIVDVNTQKVIKTIFENHPEEAKEEIISFAFHPSGKKLATASRNFLLRYWDLETNACLKTIKAQDNSPILHMHFDPTGTLLATGGSGRSIKVYDIEKGFCTHNFNGHSGVITAIRFHPNPKHLQLVSSSEDSTVRVWDLYSQKCKATITDHMSPVTCLAFSPNGSILVTGGRDRVINFWDLHRSSLIKTVPVYEVIEGISVVAKDKEGFNVITAGANGTLREWECKKSKSKEVESCICKSESQPFAESIQFTGLLTHTNKKHFYAITSDHNIVTFDYSLQRLSQLIGFNDDIIALRYIRRDFSVGENEKCIADKIAMATNSDQIRLLDYSTLSCDLLTGHKDVVLSLDVSPDGRWLVSSSKDHTCRLWEVESQRCLSVCVGHVESIGAVCFSKRRSNFSLGTSYFVSGSADKTLKLWSLKSLRSAYTGNDEVPSDVKIVAVHNQRAHDKDINALSVSPNDRFVASGSQDRSIKIWNSSDLSLHGTLKGHKRGIWSIEFSPVDQCLASSSGDRTIKIWSIKEMVCLKTFEGHTASVLNVRFVSAGMQLVSTGADGLIKLWTIKNNECENTFDSHMDKIWALDISPDNTEMISGGSDSRLNFWTNCTQEDQLKTIKEQEEILVKNQTLANLLRTNDYQKAVELAFDLDHPRQLFIILTQILEGVKNEDSPKAAFDFKGLLSSLDETNLVKLLKWTTEWNTNSKSSVIAQWVLTNVLTIVTFEQLEASQELYKLINGLVAYTERHFRRLERLVIKSYLVDYTLFSMKKYLPLDDDNINKRQVDCDDENEKVYKRPKVV